MTWPITIRRRVRRLLQEVSELELDGRGLGLARKAAEILPELRERAAPLRLVPPPRVAPLDKGEGARGRRRRVYAAVMARDGGICTAAGFQGLRCSGVPELDHQWGRGRDRESVENVRILCTRHHRMKTDSAPTRARWLLQFREHATAHGYDGEVAKVERALALERAQHPEAVE
ncbi:MAG: hypothetical protein JXA90_09055 [Planctomycetes bacterium]|nr:hypothetical protein [Planctomycetota bacterium]